MSLVTVRNLTVSPLAVGAPISRVLRPQQTIDLQIPLDSLSTPDVLYLLRKNLISLVVAPDPSIPDDLETASVQDITQVQEQVHPTLLDLIHFVDEGPTTGFTSGAYKETLPAGDPFPTSEIWWTSAGKVGKFVELVIVRDSAQKPTTETWSMYSADGVTVASTVVDSYTYDGPFEVSRTRSIA
jgi:hypothetical protein